MPQVVNLQRKLRLDSKAFAKFAERLIGEVPEAAGKDFAVAFISDRRMKELNSFFRGKDSTTDVLSFPHEPDEFQSVTPAIEGGLPQSVDTTGPNAQLQPPAGGSDYLGDIVISAEQAQKQAEENGLKLENEIKQLILHGLLHLCGYDHETDEGEMNARELELRDKLGI